MDRYTVTAQSGYQDTTWTDRRKAIRYARSITDTTNSISSVYDGDILIAQYRYTSEMGGKTYRAQI